MRAIEELARAVAAITGLRRSGAREEALKAVEDAKGLLPLVPGLIDRLSANALVQMLDDRQLRERLSALYRHEAELCYLLGQHARAVRCASRAEALEASNVEQA